MPRICGALKRRSPPRRARRGRPAAWARTASTASTRARMPKAAPSPSASRRIRPSVLHRAAASAADDENDAPRIAQGCVCLAASRESAPRRPIGRPPMNLLRRPAPGKAGSRAVADGAARYRAPAGRGARRLLDQGRGARDQARPRRHAVRTRARARHQVVARRRTRRGHRALDERHVRARAAIIPGRNVIGIELPNVRRETVYLRDIFESRRRSAPPTRSCRWRSASRSAVSRSWRILRACRTCSSPARPARASRSASMP